MTQREAVVACIPHDAGLGLLGDLPDGASVIVWDGETEAPPQLDAVSFFAAFYVPGRHVAAALAELPKLEVVQAMAAGVDLIAPIVPEGVTLCSGRGGPTPATSEWVLTVILAVLRDIPALAADQAIGATPRRMYDGLDGKRVTILGYGSIGPAVERRMSGFDVAITRVARSAREGVLAVEELDAVLPHTDVLVILTPLTEETRGLLGAERLAALPDGALVVNAARGGIVDEQALAAELQVGRLRAALDVSEPDPLPPEHPLRRAPGLLYTPHVAGASPITIATTYRLIGDQLRRFAAGEPLHNVV